jgi:hypothetical protein
MIQKELHNRLSDKHKDRFTDKKDALIVFESLTIRGWQPRGLNIFYFELPGFEV